MAWLIPCGWVDNRIWPFDSLESLFDQSLKIDTPRRDSPVNGVMNGYQTPKGRQETSHEDPAPGG